MNKYISEDYVFKYNIGGNIAIYKPNTNNAFSSISGPNKKNEYNYKLECEKWLLSKGIKSQEEYDLTVNTLWLKYEL